MTIENNFQQLNTPSNTAGPVLSLPLQNKRTMNYAQWKGEVLVVSDILTNAHLFATLSVAFNRQSQLREFF